MAGLEIMVTILITSLAPLLTFVELGLLGQLPNFFFEKKGVIPSLQQLLLSYSEAMP